MAPRVRVTHSRSIPGDIVSPLTVVTMLGSTTLGVGELECGSTAPLPRLSDADHGREFIRHQLRT